MIFSVLNPEVMVAPTGNVHEYPCVAFGIEGIEKKMPVSPWQIIAVPIILPAALGKLLTVIGKFDGIPVQVLLTP